MKLEVQSTLYEVPNGFRVEITDDTDSLELKIREVKGNYYAEKYGDGENIILNKLVGAALNKEVTLEVVGEKGGLKARDGDVHVLVEKATPPKKKKAKKETTEDSHPEDSES